MIILFAVLGLVLLVGVAVRFALPVVRRQRLAWELRRDWWSQFERDFRTYVRVTQGANTRGRARPGH